jgi:hypothetical protein
MYKIEQGAKMSDMTKEPNVTKQSEKWVTLTEAAGVVDRSVPTLSSMCSRRKIKARKSDGKFPLSRIVEEVEASALRDLRHPSHTGGPRGELKDEKLREEIGILRAKRAELEGRSVPREEALGSARELVALFRDVFSQWVGAVKVMTNDVRLVAEAERLRDRALATMQEKLQ